MIMPLPIWTICCFSLCLTSANELFRTNSGEIFFRSDAALELIEANSNQLRGIIDISKGTFAFAVKVSSFEGFNNGLQREHFKENYMDISKYPSATFSGKIIERIDFSVDGRYEIRAKGKLNIHGVKRERIIKSVLEKKGNQFYIKSYFTVLLKEHNITIPRIVNQKIAEEIQIQINATLTKE